MRTKQTYVEMREISDSKKVNQPEKERPLKVRSKSCFQGSF